MSPFGFLEAVQGRLSASSRMLKRAPWAGNAQPVDSG